jgi:RNA polymerase sigma-70 factor (ECF subfamily)
MQRIFVVGLKWKKSHVRLFRKTGGKELSDNELIRRFRMSNDTKFVGELVQRYTHTIYGTCFKYLKNEEDAKDAVIEIYEHLTRVLVTHEVGNFKNWLYVVTKNHCRMKLRKQQTLPRLVPIPIDIEDVFFMENAAVVHPEDEREGEAQLARLAEALSRLNDAQRTCIELFYLEGKRYKEISALMALPEKQVKSHIQNGKRNLKNLLVEREV